MTKPCGNFDRTSVGRCKTATVSLPKDDKRCHSLGYNPIFLGAVVIESSLRRSLSQPCCGPANPSSSWAAWRRFFFNVLGLPFGFSPKRVDLRARLLVFFAEDDFRRRPAEDTETDLGLLGLVRRRVRPS